jgi:hypothetical protein
MVLTIIQTPKLELALNGEIFKNLDAEVLKRRLLERDLELYFEYNRFFHDKVREKYYSQVKIKFNGHLGGLGYEGLIKKEYEEVKYKHFASWFTKGIEPTLYHAYDCFLESLLLALT